MMGFFITLGLLLIAAFCLYKKYKKLVTTWKSRNVPYFYSLKTVFFMEMNGTVERAYQAYPNERVVGSYAAWQPVLVLRDPELVKMVCVKEFDNFVNRSQMLKADVDPVFGKSLPLLLDNKWRDMRNTLSPAFTTSKIKIMKTFFDKCGEQLIEYINTRIEESPSKVAAMEVQNVFMRLTNDVIASTAFGVRTDSFKDPKNNFFTMGQKITSGFRSGFGIFRIVFMVLLPSLAKLFGITFLGKEGNSFFVNIINSNIKEREEKNIVRPDMVHLLMQARKGLLAEESEVPRAKILDLSNVDIAAQAIQFFLAGFHPTALLLSCATHELALHPEIQEKLREEIRTIVKEDGGFTYENLMYKMKYLDMVVNESFRKWPPARVFDRNTSRKFTFPATDDSPALTVEKGEWMWVPIYNLHHDPKHFPNPEKFDPERFSEVGATKNNLAAFIPFGVGPRACIGKRYALLAIKSSLAQLLLNFKIETVAETQIPLKLVQSLGSVLAAEKGFWLGFRKL